MGNTHMNPILSLIANKTNSQQFIRNQIEKVNAKCHKNGVNFSSLKELPISPINQNYKDASEDNNFLSTPKKFIIKKSIHDNFQDSLKDTRKSTRSKTHSSLPPSKSTFYEMNEKKIKNDHDSKWNFYSNYNLSQSSLKVLPEIKLHKEEVKEESKKLVSLNKNTDKEK